MFFHLLKYKLVHLFHYKEKILWVFLFPIALGTFFFIGFGNMMTNIEEFEPIPVATVSGQQPDDTLTQVIKELSAENDDQLLAATWTTEEKAKQLLEDNKVDGIIYVEETPSLTILENGLNQSILNSFLSQYISRSYALQQIGKEQPEQLVSAIETISADVSYNKDVSVNGSDTDNLIQYFYALIAMVCLYGCLLGQDASLSIQPHLSPIGARKNVAPVHKLKVILAEFLACIMVDFLSILLLFFYLIVILKIDLGSRVPQLLLASFVGSVIGVSFGMFTASVGKSSHKTKEGICFAIVMLCCFLGGLMVNTMPMIINQFAPWINRINPAALLSDCFYSLNVCSDYARFQKDLLYMLVIAGIFCFGSYLLLRRKTV